MMQWKRNALWFGLAAVLLITAGCGGSTGLPGPVMPRLAQPEILGFSAKVVSGVPAGLYVTWTRDDSPFTQGYYLYRDIVPIPYWTPGNAPAGLRTNGGSVIPQPSGSDPVTFNDVFVVDFGQTYYYRVTAVNLAGDESDPSAEKSFTVANFTVDTLTPDQAYWGDEVAIGGTQFGASQGPFDNVQFSIVGGGTVEATVTSWTDTEITVVVPDLAVSGPLDVVVSSVLAQSPILTILQPTIIQVAPAQGFLEQPLNVGGVNFGASQGASTVAINGVDVPPAAITSWTDAEIILTVPVSTQPGDVVVTVDGRLSNSLPFTVRPEIQGIDPLTAETGEPVTLTGRRFGATQGRVLLDGTTELAVTAWADNSITFTIAGAEAVHQLTVARSDDVLSNDQVFGLVPPLSVSFTGLTDGQLYRTGDTASLTVTTADDAARVELLLDGAVASESTTAPFSDLHVNPAVLANGSHIVQLRAHRRAVSADSSTVTIKAYSLVGDVNGDGVVDDLDRETLAGLLGLTPADAGYEVWIDTDEDGLVTEADAAWIGYNFGNALP